MDKIKFEEVDICCTKKDNLKIVSALLQDSIIPYTLFQYKKKEKSVQILLNRFCHENDQKLYKGFVDSVLGFDSSILEPQEEVVMEFE